MVVTIYWTTNNKTTRDRIRDRFNMPYHTTVNGETTAEIKDEDMPVLLEVQKRGYIQIRKK